MGKIFNMVVLDESGSMTSIYDQALSGVNETINTIRLAKKDNPQTEQLFAFVTFDSGSDEPNVRLKIDCKPIGEVKDVTTADYRPRGCTPLYDAIGWSVNYLAGKVEDGDSVLVTIVTDGYENASVEYGAASVKKLVDAYTEKGWVFTYIGANQDSKDVSGKLGIQFSMDFAQDEVGTKMMWDKMNSSRMSYYKRAERRFMGEAVAENDFFCEMTMGDRVTPEVVTALGEGQVFVFGTDINGTHCGVAGRFAQGVGAHVGQAEGLQGQAYAIPTTGIRDLDALRESVSRFIDFARANPDKTFLVTRIGCGGSGFRDEQIAPLFASALSVDNIHLPQSFWNIINYKFAF